jgi:lipid-A-disaccharide synthase
MVAGETSGDLLSGLLIDGMRAKWPAMHSFGIGGPQMAARGFDARVPSEKLAVHGFGLDVLLRYREIVGIRRRLRESLLKDPPDIFIGVDAPDFNLDLETDLRASGTATAHFVCPSVWAWRPHRIEKIRRAADHVLCIFPFEPALLQAHGISASYVGHPLASVIPMEPDRAAARRQLGLQAEEVVVALLPGSRLSEVRHLTSLFLESAALMRRANPSLRFLLPAVPALRERIDRAVAASGLADCIMVLNGHSHRALAACDVTLVASGTATLEAALFKRPMVIAYRMQSLSWRLLAPKRLQPWVGLPNILCEDFVVPEFLQDAATPEALARSTLDWVSDPHRVDQLNTIFTALHESLRRDTASLATDAIENVLSSHPNRG